jgi:hypothetical protein
MQDGSDNNKKSISSKEFTEKPYIEGVKVIRPENNSISSETYKGPATLNRA